MAVFLLAGCAAQPTGGPHFLAGGAPIGDFRLPVTSVQEMRFAGIIRQQFDFSCGSASLATLLRFHYDFDVREDNAFRGMWASGDQAQIRNVGFSLLDMKRWLGTRGLSADGYEVTLDQIAETGLPGIALIAVKNYRHFVVVKGVSETEVLLGDPSVGIVIMPREEFQQAWNGIYFALADEPEIARRNFNSGQQWAAFARAPVGNRLTDPVSQQALMLTAPFFGDIS